MEHQTRHKRSRAEDRGRRPPRFRRRITPDILAYPQDRAAWGRLTRLLSLGKLRAEKGECLLGLPDLFDFIAGLNLIVMAPARIDRAAMLGLLARLTEAAAPDSVWLAASLLYRGDDGAVSPGSPSSPARPPFP